MLLRSVNAPITSRNLVGGDRLTSVIYTGPVNEFAIITARVQLVGTVFLFGNVLSFGVRVPRNELMGVLTRWELGFCNVGVVVTLTVVHMASLRPGDTIECWLAQQAPGSWLLAANGFTALVL